MKDIIKEDNYERAKKRVAKIKGFYIHLTVYLIANAFIITMNTIALGWEGFISSLLSVSLFWGIGLLFHWYGVFGKNLFFSKEWEERKIQELMNKDKLL